MDRAASGDAVPEDVARSIRPWVLVAGMGALLVFIAEFLNQDFRGFTLWEGYQNQDIITALFCAALVAIVVTTIAKPDLRPSQLLAALVVLGGALAGYYFNSPFYEESGLTGIWVASIGSLLAFVGAVLACLRTEIARIGSRDADGTRKGAALVLAAGILIVVNLFIGDYAGEGSSFQYTNRDWNLLWPVFIAAVGLWGLLRPSEISATALLAAGAYGFGWNLIGHFEFLGLPETELAVGWLIYLAAAAIALAGGLMAWRAARVDVPARVA